MNIIHTSTCIGWLVFIFFCISLAIGNSFFFYLTWDIIDFSFTSFKRYMYNGRLHHCSHTYECTIYYFSLQNFALLDDNLLHTPPLHCPLSQSSPKSLSYFTYGGLLVIASVYLFLASLSSYFTYGGSLVIASVYQFLASLSSYFTNGVC